MRSETVENLRQLKENLEKAFSAAGSRKWAGAVDHIWAFGPRGNGPNILLNQDSDYKRPSVWTSVEARSDPIILKELIGNYRECDHSLVSGFQLASLSGPLCEEPMHGVCFIIEKWDLDLVDKSRDPAQQPRVDLRSQESSSEKAQKNVKFADEENNSNDERFVLFIVIVRR